MNAATTCTKCYHATRPLPSDWTAVDFFDKPVIAQEAVFRTTCTAVPDAVKPCLRPAPAVEPTDDMGGLDAAIPADVQSELYQLRNVVGLAAFACEARRVLEEIDQVARMIPELGDTLNRLISTRNEWSELGNHTSDVLNDVRKRINTLLGEEGQA